MPAAKTRAPLGRLTLALDPTISPHTRAVLREILDHAGLFVHEVLPALLPAALEEAVPQVAVLAGKITEKEAALLQEPLSAFVRRGGGVVGLGGAGAPSGQAGAGVLDGLFELFGLAPILNESFEPPGFGQSPWRTMGEGWLRIRDKEHPILEGFGDVPLHVFGGQAVRPAKHDGSGAAKVLAGLAGAGGKRRACAALTERKARTGAGTALFIAADLAGSAALIRGGRPVVFDGVSAPDGSAPIADGLLKAEDGLVLDFLRDRRWVDAQGRPAKTESPGPKAWPIFDQPIADALAQVLLRAIFHAAFRTGVRLPRLWYHADGLAAVGHISHDTDGNKLELAERLREVLAEADVRSTWCTIHPGYEAPFYRKLKDFGHEIALHYDATGGPREPFRRWGAPNFDFQFRWLLDAAGLQGPEALVSNKNHYTRWENGLEFLEWCARDGIQLDQSKGPSKRGTIGYPFGSCHPHWQYDRNGRRVDVLEQAFQTQDLVITAPPAWGRLFVERARRWHGVCHLLFHPAHIAKPGVAQSLLKTVAHGRKKGLRWLTARQINAFERARRACVEAGAECLPDGSLRLRAPAALPGATLMVLGWQPFGVSRGRSGAVKDSEKRTCRREGFPWKQARVEHLQGEAALR